MMKGKEGKREGEKRENKSVRHITVDNTKINENHWPSLCTHLDPFRCVTTTIRSHIR